MMRRLAMMSLIAALASCGDPAIEAAKVYRDRDGAAIPAAKAERMLAASRVQDRQRLDPLADAAAQEVLIRRKNGWRQSGTAVRLRDAPRAKGPIDDLIAGELAKRKAQAPGRANAIPAER